VSREKTGERGQDCSQGGHFAWGAQSLLIFLPGGGDNRLLGRREISAKDRFYMGKKSPGGDSWGRSVHYEGTTLLAGSPAEKGVREVMGGERSRLLLEIGSRRSRGRSRLRGSVYRGLSPDSPERATLRKRGKASYQRGRPGRTGIGTTAARRTKESPAKSSPVEEGHERLHETEKIPNQAKEPSAE